uniref:Rattus norvegicus profilaggrin-like n=1 Tax=Oryza sativa subsp. japonica TaxID=39947 RepID=Q6K9A9_ORYSJ|nr:Rattus norvegicus profilaggrin-like [Oryza sativa Japonica Group]BAD19241.1 Rattus norvegicus profilaggrin-like [Oryza sativa Japonica Group]
MERTGRAKWADRPKAAQDARVRGREERESRWTGLTARGPGWDPLVGDTAHCAERARGVRARAGEERGACARAHAQPHGSRWNALTGGADRGRPVPTSAELAPTWRLRGCHAGRREVDDDTGRNGRRTIAASGGANHGDTGESEHTGWLHETRGNEPTARIRRRKLDGGESRRRQPAGREEGNGDEVTKGRFPAVRASTRPRKSDASVGLGGATPSEAGDERVLRSSGGNGGEYTASDGNGEEMERGGRTERGTTVRVGVL